MTDELVEVPACGCGEPWCDVCAYQREQAVSANPCPTCKGSGLNPDETTDPQPLIAKAREVCEGATPGPWGVRGGHGGNIWLTDGADIATWRDVHFLSESRSLVPALADALEEATGTIAGWTDSLNGVVTKHLDELQGMREAVTGVLPSDSVKGHPHLVLALLAKSNEEREQARTELADHKAKMVDLLADAYEKGRAFGKDVDDRTSEDD